MKIKVNKILLEVALMFQAKQDVRYYLNGICFMPGGRIASTDGHRAFIAEGGEHKLKDNVIVKVSKSPTKRYEYAIIDTKTKIVTYHDESDVMVGAGICEEVDGRFPDIGRVVPKKTEPTDRIGFNAQYLADIAKAVKVFNPKYQSISLELQGKTDSAVVKAISPLGFKATFVVMPMRID